MIIKPPIVGVPAFSTCPSKPKSLIVSPTCCFCKNRIIRLPNIVENNNDNKDLTKLINCLRNLDIITLETISKIEEAYKEYSEVNQIQANPIKINNTIKKYQVFISSTYIDLKDDVDEDAIENALDKMKKELNL